MADAGRDRTPDDIDPDVLTPQFARGYGAGFGAATGYPAADYTVLPLTEEGAIDALAATFDRLGIDSKHYGSAVLAVHALDALRWPRQDGTRPSADASGQT